MKQTIINGKALSQMTLGTVQLGLNYGIANKSGQPDINKSTVMLSCALQNGITSLDTARGYGTSEDVLGKFFRENKDYDLPFLTSKFIIGLPETATQKEVESAIFNSVETSLEKLGVNKLDCLMHHRAHEMTVYGDIVQKTLNKLIAENYIGIAGVSVYGPDDLDSMLNFDIYQAVQIPMSIFDQKLIKKGYLSLLKERGITVFVRSVFLQGLFFLNPSAITDPILVEYAKPYIEKLHEFCKKSGMSIAEFAISFIRDIPGVTSLVLGADTEEQILQNINYLKAPKLPDKLREEVYEAFCDVNIPKIMEVLSRGKS